MGFLLACARKDLLRRLADPMSLLLWIGIPLVLGGLITLVSSGGGGALRAKVLLVDQDDTFASQLLAGLFRQGPGEGLFEAREVDLEEGRRAIDAGEASALVVLPAGFAEALLLEEPATLELVTNPAQRILPGLVEETLRAVVDLSFYAHRLLGPQVQEIRRRIDEEREPDRADVMRIAGEVQDALEGVEEVLFPPVLELETAPLSEEQDEDEPADRSIALLMFPGILLMSLLFVGQGASEDLWRERALGTLRRAACAPGSLGVLLLGKLLATGAVMLGIALLGALLMAAFFPLGFLPALAGALWATAASVVFALLMLLLQSLAGSQRGGGLVTMLVLFPLLMLGGSFFPFEAMPEGLASIGRRLPNGMALVELKRILDGAVDLGSLARTAGALAAGGALLYGLLLVRLRRGFATGGSA